MNFYDQKIFLNSYQGPDQMLSFIALARWLTSSHVDEIASVSECRPRTATRCMSLAPSISAQGRGIIFIF